MAVGIPTGFVRKLYRILDNEDRAIISWDESSVSFSLHNSAALDTQILPRYYRGRLCAFRQQLVDHGFARCDYKKDDTKETYQHPDFLKGQPGRLSKIERKPKRNGKITCKNNEKTLKRKDGIISDKTGSTSAETLTPRISLKVTLNVQPIEGRKRRRPSEEAGTYTAERDKMSPVQTPPKKSKNPLFSDHPEPLTNFVQGTGPTGLLPTSLELPVPISYLNGDANQLGRTIETSQRTGIEAEGTGPMISDDIVKSTLFFLASSSSGVETKSAGVTFAAAIDSTSTVELPTAMTSTSDFLESLLASSSTGGTTVTSFANGCNPLFSDQTAAGDEDSIWNILVSSSVDRVRSTIGQVESPQERVRLILEEREKLEEQRWKVGSLAAPIMPRRPTSGCPLASAAMENSRPQKQQNPLFATDSSSGSGFGGQMQPAEDDLWKLLMSSSIDSFRRVMETDR